MKSLRLLLLLLLATAVRATAAAPATCEKWGVFELELKGLVARAGGGRFLRS